MLKLKPNLKTNIDPAKELVAAGEAARSIFGELSISLERLFKIKDDNLRKEAVNLLIKESDKLMREIYRNQAKTRRLIWKIFFLIACVLGLIFFLLPLIQSILSLVQVS